MLKLSIAAIALSLAAGSLQAQADEPPASRVQATIHFANSGGINNWQADGTQAIYIEDREHNWYHARLMSPCMDLPFTEHVGFETEPNGDFDDFSAIVTGHEKCPVVSLTKSGKPSAKK